MLEMQETDPRGRTEQTPSRFLEYLNLTPEERSQMAQDGLRFFVKASKESPGSVTVQGALIAGYCQEEGIDNPLLLSECLTRDSDKVIRLVLMAERVHKHAGKDEKIGNIGLKKMRGVIRHDFKNASKFLGFTPEQLAIVVNEIGPKIKRGNPKSEDHFLQEALRIPQIQEEDHHSALKLPQSGEETKPSLAQKITDHVLPKGREVLIWARNHTR